MNFPRRLLLFWCVSIAAVALGLMVLFALAMQRIAVAQQQSRLTALMQDVAIAVKDPNRDLDIWLPPLLGELEIRSFDLWRQQQRIYHYAAPGAVRDDGRRVELSVRQAPDLRVVIQSAPVWSQFSIPASVWGLLAAAIAGLGLVLWLGWRWLAPIATGVAQINLRSRQILNGQGSKVARDVAAEFPQEASKAIDFVLDQLDEARQERTRFDKFIRSNTFLDMETGFGNRLFFDTRLEAALNDYEPGTGGGVYLLQLRELDQIEHRLGESAAQDVVNAFGQLLRAALKGQTGAIVARRSSADFAVLAPDLNPKEAEDLAMRMVRMLRRLTVPAGIDRESFVHVGLALYQQGDEPYQVLSEADMALRAAQLQGPIGYYMYDRSALDRNRTYGSVRWRTMLELAVEKRAFVLFLQSAVSAEGGTAHHHEVLSRMRDDKGHLISAGVFLPMAARCGMTPKIDRIILEQLLRLLEQDRGDREPCSVNLSPETLVDQSFMGWLEGRIQDKPILAHRLIIEVSEFHLAHQMDQLGPALQRLKRLGCSLLVDRVGQTVVGSQYITKLSIDYLKLHPSIVRNIHARPENQLFVRSLQGSINADAVKVFALGVETDAEWRALRGLGVFGGQGHFFSEQLEKLAECAQN